MWTPGPLEIVIILVIVLIIFGPKRLPDLGKSLGRGTFVIQVITKPEGAQRRAAGAVHPQHGIRAEVLGRGKAA